MLSVFALFIFRFMILTAISRLYKDILIKVSLLKFGNGALVLASFTCQFIAITNRAITPDGFLSKNFSLWAIHQITFSISYKEAFKSFLPYLIRIHPEYIGIGCRYHSSSDFYFLRICQNAFIGIGYYACLQASLQVSQFVARFLFVCNFRWQILKLHKFATATVMLYHIRDDS